MPSRRRSTPPAWLVLNGDSLWLRRWTPCSDDQRIRIEGVLQGLHVADASRYGTLLQDAAAGCGIPGKRPGAASSAADLPVSLIRWCPHFRGQPLSF